MSGQSSVAFVALEKLVGKRIMSSCHKYANAQLAPILSKSIFRSRRFSTMCLSPTRVTISRVELYSMEDSLIGSG